MYKKFTYVTRETYRLDHITEVELGKKKIDYSEFGAMHLFYRNDYQKFLEYNIRDVELVEELDDFISFNFIRLPSSIFILLFNQVFKKFCRTFLCSVSTTSSTITFISGFK